jgi:hypothetical protein
MREWYKFLFIIVPARNFAIIFRIAAGSNRCYSTADKEPPVFFLKRGRWIYKVIS